MRHGAPGDEGWCVRPSRWEICRLKGVAADGEEDVRGRGGAMKGICR